MRVRPNVRHVIGSRPRLTSARRTVIETLEPRTHLSAAPGSAGSASLSSLQRMLVRRAALDTSHRASPKAGNASSAATSSQIATTTMDTIVFGDAASESAHGLVATGATTVASAALGQAARQLQPLNPLSVNGGDLTFDVAVDPVQRNYVSVKLWSGDDTDFGKGRLYLYVPLNGVNYQVGFRHEGDYTPVSVTTAKQPLPGRFFYSTTILPLWMTQGKSSIRLKIQSTGELYGGGSGGPTSSPVGNYQFNMDTPSRHVFRAYTHTQPKLDVSGEVQGAAPTTTTRPASNESSILGTSGSYTLGIKNWVLGRIGAAYNSYTTTNVEAVARSYSVAQMNWTTAQKTQILDALAAAIDGFAADWYTNGVSAVTSSNYGADGGNEVWGGRFGNLGMAIDLLKGNWGGRLDAVVNFGPDGGNRARRDAWGDMLQASRDWARLNRDARSITNQAVYADSHLYMANRGMLALGDPQAFAEPVAQRYIKEAAGLLPYLGSDLPNGGHSMKHGTGYYLTTVDGLTREWGYAGGYSEIVSEIARFVKWTNDPALRDHVVKLSKALAYMRRPAVEVSGSNYYRSFERTGLLGFRGVRDADGYLANEISYGGYGTEAMLAAGATMDPTLIGYGKQMLADNQFLYALTSSSQNYRKTSACDVFDDYYAVKNAADSGVRLPMTSGQPDFAWTDRQDGLIVVKRGEERLWVEPYWQLKDGTATNGVGRFYYSTPTYDQFGNFETNVDYTTLGSYFVRNDSSDQPSVTRYTPFDNPVNAYTGEKLPVTAGPGDSASDEPYLGKADFWAFRFGNFLFGLNTTAGKSYTLKTPADFTSATDLVSKTTRSGTVTVDPFSATALHLGTAFDAAPVPTSPLWVQASGSPTRVTVNWSAASGATAYTVKRATSPDGPYATIASNVAALTYNDAAVARGVAYYYVVAATNGNGESYHSAQVSASAGLPTAWSNQDVGTVTLPGNAKLIDGVFTVTGEGTRIGSTSDSFHYVYASIPGAATLTARITNITDTNGSDKVGIMFRDSLSSNAKFVHFGFNDNSHTASLDVRSSTGGGTTGIGSATQINAPYWFRLVRTVSGGNSTIAGYVSPDGATWTQTGSATLATSATIYGGLTVVSRTSQQLGAATFDNVSLTGVDTVAPTLVSAASRKTHGSAGTFDAPLSIEAGPASIEPRSGGASRLVFSFSEAVYPIDGTLDANEFSIVNAAFSSATLSGGTLTLNLANVVDQALLSVALNGLRDAAGNVVTGTRAVAVRNLRGDVDRSGRVDIVDQAMVKSALRKPVTSLNFLFDVNGDGLIDIIDQSLVKSDLHHSL